MANNRSSEEWLEEIQNLATNGKLTDPLTALAKATGRGTPGVRQALERLESLDMIQLTLGERRGCGRVLESIQILDNRVNPRVKIQLVPGQVQAQAEVGKTAAILKPTTPTKSAEPISLNNVPIAVIIDFDNLTSPGVTQGGFVSFAKLRAYLRSYGRVVYSAAFLSPSATKPETISILWNSGFTAITCPFERKNKDSVDAMIKNFARFLAEFSLVHRIVIISGDTDFSDDPALINVIRDFGKEPVFINPTDIIEDVRGDDVVPELKPIIAVGTWGNIISLAEDEQGVWDEETQNKIDFVKQIAGAAAIHAGQTMQRGFKHLTQEVTRLLRRTTRSAFTDFDVQNVLSAFVDKKVLVKHVTGKATYSDGRTFYVFDRSSKLLPRATQTIVNGGSQYAFGGGQVGRL